MNTSSFPLYDSLVSICKEKKFNENEEEDFVSKLKGIDKEGYELIYALILMNSLNEGNTESLPYGSKELKTGIKFDYTLLPDNLRHILHEFVNLHKLKMKEERMRLKI